MAKNNKELANKMTSGKGVSTAGQWLQEIGGRLEAKKATIADLLPPGHSESRFIGTVMNYVRQRPELWGCHPVKLIDCFLRAAQQGLDFGVPNEAHIVAYKKDSPVLMRGYKGALKLARRAPHISFIDANVVYANDECDVELGSTPRISHKPSFGDERGDCVGFYAIAKDKDGNDSIWLMDNGQVQKHAKRFTKATNSGPFAGVTTKGTAAENWEAYGLKTVIIALCTKKLDMTTEMSEGLVEEFIAEKTGEVPVEFNLNDVADVTPEPEPEPVVAEVVVEEREQAPLL